MTALLNHLALAASLLAPTTESAPPLDDGSSASIPREESHIAQAETVSIAFQVVGPGGAPVRGAAVSARYKSPTGKWEIEFDTTGKDGRASLEMPAGKDLVWFASILDGGEQAKGSLSALTKGATKTLELVLRSKDDTVFKGVFTDLRSGGALEGVQVLQPPTSGGLAQDLIFPLGPDQIKKLRIATSDALGRIEIPAATWRTSQVIALKDGYSIAEFDVGGKPDAHGLLSVAPIRLNREPHMAFRLIGAPNGTVLRLECALANPLTGNGGRVAGFTPEPTASPGDAGHMASIVVRGVAAVQTAQLWVMQGEEKLYQLPPVEVPPRGNERLITLDLWPRGEILGKVADEAGEPSAGIKIELRRLMQRAPSVSHASDGRLLAETITDSSGRYYFERLPLGHYEVSTRHTELRGQVSSRFTTPARIKLLPDDDQRNLDLTVISGVFISGNLVGPDGEPHEGFVTGTCAHRQARAMTDWQGHFSVGPFRSGDKVHLRATGPELRDAYTSDFTAIKAPAKDIQVRLLGTAPVSGRVIGAPQEAPMVTWKVQASNTRNLSIQRTLMNALGEFSFGSLQEGKYELTVLAGSTTRSRPLKVTVRHQQATQDIILTVEK